MKISETLFLQSLKSIPGGVNSPARSFKAVGGIPVFIKSAAGCHLYDVDNNRYIDYLSSWGAIILGHNNGYVREAINNAVNKGLTFGCPTEIELRMAEMIKELSPNIELVRMVNSGTEACMSAIRVARGFTKKNKIIKFDGCYHGHCDTLLPDNFSLTKKFEAKRVAGVSWSTAKETLICPYNDIATFNKIISLHKDEIAAVIIEPVAGNMGCVLPVPLFLETIRQVCTDEGIVLIFDEVMTGFRLGLGGAQSLLNVSADLVTYGKIIGGGLPVGAFGGKRSIMETLAPIGKVYQAGTMSGNPIALTTGLTALSYLRDNPHIYTDLANQGKVLASEITALFLEASIPIHINQIGSMLSLFFSNNRITDYKTAKQANPILYSRFFHLMLKRGVYLPPSPFESWFLNAAFQAEDINETLTAIKCVLKDWH